jgi:hypothetical protein
LVSYDGVKYSIPSEYCGRELEVKVTTKEIIIYNLKKIEIARHARSHSQFKREVMDYRHYLSVLSNKPRALDQAKCIKQSDLPPVYYKYLAGLQSHQSDGNKQMIKILKLEKCYPLKDILFCMEWGIAHRTFSYDALVLTLEELKKEHLSVEKVNKEYPLIKEEPYNLSKYDNLLVGAIK